MRTEFEQAGMERLAGNRGRDKGIDLIARKSTGQSVAIQAKHYASTYYIKKAESSRSCPDPVGT